MEKRSGKQRLATGVSAACVVAAMVLLLRVCTICYPQIGQSIWEAAAGQENSPLREAFHVLADGLEAGQPVKETFSETMECFRS